jgi:protein ImuB
MFACIFGRNVCRSEGRASADAENQRSGLGDLAFTFSPLVEQTTDATLVLDISGQDLLFQSTGCAISTGEIQSARKVANAIACRAKDLKIKINVAVASNPDTAIHAARAFKGVTVIECGEELSTIESLSIKTIDYSLASIDDKRAEELQETFALWGIRTFGELARLPLPGVAERLGQEGVRLQKLAQGRTNRQLNLVRPPIGFEQLLELEHPIDELEPLSFILSRLLNQLCANLHEYAFATNELKLNLKLQDKSEQQRVITLPVPMRNPKMLLRLLLFEIEREPPQAAIVAVAIVAEPVKPRASQTGLFIPLSPEPERLEITLARLAKLVGAENVGSPEILDTHRPDAFRVKKFRLDQKTHRNVKNNSRCAFNAGEAPALPVMGLRIFRPPWRADVRLRHGTPTRINARCEQTSCSIHGEIVCVAGPWRAAGDWWCKDVWARDEWDVAVIDPASNESEVLCRIYRDLASEQWFVAGIYD